MELSQKLLRWLIEPSPQITGSDQRRQASLLSIFLLLTIALASIVETITLIWIDRSGYTGYRQTIMAIIMFLAIYAISRTEHIRIAAVLAVVTASLAIFLAGLAEPTGILGGLLDFMILPLWLASLYLSMGSLLSLILASMLAVLAIPWLSAQVTMSQILVGPFSFLLATSVLLMVFTRHRNQLEGDRQAKLTEKEERSAREAARANALLHVAERMSAQLDLDSLLNVVCEEVAAALATPVSLLALYDPAQDALVPAAAAGIPPELIKKISPIPVGEYGRQLGAVGVFPRLPSPEQFPGFPDDEFFKAQKPGALAFAAMQYENKNIGVLTAIAQQERQPFSEDELLLLQGLARQAALAITNTRLFKDARRRLEHLQALRAIDVAIISNYDLRQRLEVLLKQISEQLRVDAVVILLMDPSRQHLEYGASCGLHSSMLRFTRLRLGEGIAGRAAQQSQVLHISDLQTDPQTLAFSPSLAREGFRSYYAAPLIAQGELQGVLEIFDRTILSPDAEWLGFLEALAGQAAIAIENTTLFEDLQRTNLELSDAYDSTIEGWSRALDLRDKETEGHTQRVSELTLQLARGFGFSEMELEHIRRGALLHDIGKMGVPDEILLKPGKLTEAEWNVMRKHPEFAHEMLLPILYLRSALDIPYCHHEKWDGSGYPRGLKGEEIPLTARIFAVVDVWDALTSDRPYRSALSPQKALSYIREGSGKHFDPQVVTAFIALLEQSMGREAVYA
jgi:putative nucleotidyltransferase with HDIG domain